MPELGGGGRERGNLGNAQKKHPFLHEVFPKESLAQMVCDSSSVNLNHNTEAPNFHPYFIYIFHDFYQNSIPESCLTIVKIAFYRIFVSCLVIKFVLSVFFWQVGHVG